MIMQRFNENRPNQNQKPSSFHKTAARRPPRVIKTLKTLVNELLTRPVEQLSETYPLQAYLHALHKIEQTVGDFNADRDQRIRFLQERIIAAYHPWRAMVEAMADDLAAGRTPNLVGRHAVIAHYRRAAFERNPGLANIVLNHFRQRRTTGQPNTAETPPLNLRRRCD